MSPLHGFDPTLLVVLNLAVLAVVVGVAGGITRGPNITTPDEPATQRRRTMPAKRGGTEEQSMEVKQSVRLPAPVSEVWKRIGGFNALPDWHPMVQKSELAEGGSVRKLSIPGAGTITERLENHDDNSHTYSYAITESPLPVSDYHATIRVSQDGDEAVVEWESRFEPSGASGDDAAQTIQGIFQAGFDNLQKLFGPARS